MKTSEDKVKTDSRRKEGGGERNALTFGVGKDEPRSSGEDPCVPALKSCHCEFPAESCGDTSKEAAATDDVPEEGRTFPISSGTLAYWRMRRPFVAKAKRRKPFSSVMREPLTSVFNFAKGRGR
jgi:hypothetical protein